MITRKEALEYARRIADRLRAKWGDKIWGVYLIGSYALNRQKRDSDLDIAVVTGEEANYMSKLYLRFEITKRSIYAELKDIMKELREKGVGLDVSVAPYKIARYFPHPLWIHTFLEGIPIYENWKVRELREFVRSQNIEIIELRTKRPFSKLFRIK